MKRLLIALVLLSATAFGQSVGTVFFQASYTQSAGTVATPTFNNGTGSYAGSVTVTISDSTDSASIFYCTAVGSDCTPGTAYTVPVVISVTNTHLCANASKASYTTSATACATYTITASSPAPAYVQSCSNHQAWGTTVACTLNGVGAGNLLLIGTWNATSKTIVSVTDSNGTVSSQLATVTHTGLSGVLSAYSVVNTTAGTHTITFTINGDGTPDVWVAEVSGAATSNPVDGTGTASCSTTCQSPALSSDFTTTSSNDLIWAVGRVGTGNSLTAGSDYTIRQTQGTGYMEDGIAAAAGTNHAAFTNASLVAYYMVAVAIKHP